MREQVEDAIGGQVRGMLDPEAAELFARTVDMRVNPNIDRKLD